MFYPIVTAISVSAAILFSIQAHGKVIDDSPRAPYVWSAVSLVNTDLFERTHSAMGMREVDLVCGKEPSFKNRDAWYEYGDCSGYYGPLDAAE